MRQVRILWATFALSARDRLRQKTEVLGTCLLLGLLLFIFTRLWQAVEVAGGDSGRWSVTELVWYLLAAEIVVMSPGWAHLRMAEDVRSGDVAISLLRPVSPVLAEVARATGTAFARAGLLLLAGAPTAFALVGAPEVGAAELAAGGALVALAILVSCVALALIGVLAFWLEEVKPLFWIWQKALFVLGGLMVPLDLYPAWLQGVAAWLPFRAMVYGPARTAIHFDAAFALRAAGVLSLWLGVLLAALHVVHALGCRRLQVNGG